MKKQKNILLPFIKGSSCSRRPYKFTRINARLSRKKAAGYADFLKKISNFFLKSLKVTVCSLLLLPVLIFAEDFYTSFLQIDDFLLKDIEIKGNYFITEKNILAKAGLRKGDNLVALDPLQVAGDIQSLTVVKDVRVTKVFPGKLSIMITERDPVFASGEKEHLLDEEGIRLPFERDSFNVPEIYGFRYDPNGDVSKDQQDLFGKTVEAVRRFYSIGKNMPSSIQSITVKNKIYMTVTFQDDVEVKLPLDFYDEHFERLVFVYNDLINNEVPFHTIDLTFNNVVVKKKKTSKKL